VAEYVPVDEKEREFIRKTHDLSLAVRAGAGTGKTTLLIDKLMSLIREGRADLEKVVAITFTERAAAELALRLRDELEKAREEERRRGKDSPTARRLEDAYSKLERAHISTIHSFCSSLLRERPVEAELDPAFRPMDQLESNLLRDQAWDDWLGRQMSQGAEVLRRMLRLEVKLKDIKSVAIKLLEHVDLLDAQREKFETPQVFWEGIERQGEEFAGYLKAKCSDSSDLLYTKAMGTLEYLYSICSLAEEEREEFGYGDIVGFEKPGGAGSKRNWDDDPKNIRNRIKEFIGEVENQIQEYYWGGLTEEMIEWLTHHRDSDNPGFVPYYQKIKDDKGLVDFSDLLLKTCKMLRENKGVRADFQEQFSHILVDEFQDTDPLQVEIVFFLAEDGARADNWREVELARGKLFIVGDPMQSIYRFRRADIATYRRAEGKVVGEGREAINLSQNFRSQVGIISWVNRTFNEIFDRHRPKDVKNEPYYSPYSHIKALPHHDIDQPKGMGLGVHLLCPRVGMWGQREWRETVENLSELEAKAVAALIKRMVEEGWPIWERGHERKMEYRDIALLLPKYGRCQYYEGALLAQEIPYLTEGGKEFFERTEVSWTVNLLTALDNPQDAVSVYGALKSPFFGLADEELLLFKHQHNHLDYLADDLGEGDVAGALGVLRDLHQQRTELSIGGLVERLYAQTRVREFYYLLPNGERRVANLNKVVQLGRSFDEMGGETLSSFCRYLGTVREWREEESSLLESGGDYVQLLSIHKAKGLEFPVVFLLDLGGTYTSPTVDVTFISEWEGGSIHLKAGSLRTRGFQQAEMREQERDLAERLRLLYVACTRAKDYLVLGCFIPRKRSSRRYHSLFGDLPKEFEDRLQGEDYRLIDASLLEIAEEEERTRIDELVALSPSLGDQEYARRERWLERRRELFAREELERYPLRWPSEKKVVRDGRERTEDGEEKAGERDEPGLRPQVEKALAFGTAFHRLMERVDFADGEGVEGVAEEVVRDLDLPPDKAQELTGMAEKFLTSPFAERVLACKRIFKELPFSVKIEEEGKALLMEGSIDLVLEEDGGLVLVDYKTDKLRGRKGEEIVQGYKEQMDNYGKAVRRATGREVKEIGIWLARSGEYIRVE